MANLQQRRSQNVTGDFYVDSTCIDCDTCRWMAPEVFEHAEGQSAVHHQPTGEKERLHALQALLACPTASIGTVEKPTEKPLSSVSRFRWLTMFTIAAIMLRLPLALPGTSFNALKVIF